MEIKVKLYRNKNTGQIIMIPQKKKLPKDFFKKLPKEKKIKW